MSAVIDRCTNDGANGELRLINGECDASKMGLII
jgi:hypothetical protein